MQQAALFLRDQPERLHRNVVDRQLDGARVAAVPEFEKAATVNGARASSIATSTARRGAVERNPMISSRWDAVSANVTPSS